MDVRYPIGREAAAIMSLKLRRFASGWGGNR